MPIKSKALVPASEDEVAQLRQKTSAMVEAANSLAVDSPESKARAIDLIKEAKAWGDVVEEKRTSITKPLDLAKKNTQKIFVPMKDEVDRVISIYKLKLIEYDDQLEAERAAAQAKLLARVEKGTLRPETAEKKLALVASPVKTEKTDSGSTGTMRTDREVVIDNPELVPDEFWVIDEVALRKAVLAADTAREPLPAGTSIKRVKGVTIS